MLVNEKLEGAAMDSEKAKAKASDAERLAKLDQKIDQLKAQKQALEARAKEKERKARTRRLIQNGALAEMYLGCEGVEPEVFEKALQEAGPALAQALQAAIAKISGG